MNKITFFGVCSKIAEKRIFLINFIKIRASIVEIWQKYVAQAFLPPPLNRQLRTLPLDIVKAMYFFNPGDSDPGNLKKT